MLTTGIALAQGGIVRRAVGVLGEQSDARIGPLTRGPTTRRRHLHGRAPLSDGIIEVQHGQQQIGAIPLLPRPVRGARGKPRIEQGVQLRIVEAAIREAGDDPLGRQRAGRIVNASRKCRGQQGAGGEPRFRIGTRQFPTVRRRCPRRSGIAAALRHPALRRTSQDP